LYNILVEVAKNLLGKNLPEDLIAETIGLSPEQIQKIKEGKTNLQ
jgi:hypothetical protein